jgi:hypothetical protein
MAVWQWTVTIVPKTEVIDRFDLIPDFIDQDWFESIDWWVAIDEGVFVSFFNRILSEMDAPWAKNTRIWGDDARTDCSLTVESGVVTFVWIRIDLRTLYHPLIESFIEFAQHHRFVFYSIETGRFIEPDLQQVHDAIKSSRPMAFVTNPNKFFSDKRYLESLDSEARKKADNFEYHEDSSTDLDSDPKDTK